MNFGGDGFRLTALAFGVLAPSAVMAQGALPGPVEATATIQNCELHVWPSKGLRSVLTDWLHGGIVDGAITHRKGYQAILADPIDTAAQRAVLSSVDLPQMFGLKSYQAVVHRDALDRKGVNNVIARSTPSTSPCYAELSVDDVFLQQDFVNGSTITTLFRFRSYGTSQLPELSFGTWVKASLKSFPPKTGADGEAATREVRAAFLKNILSFQGQLQNLGKPKRN